MPARPSRRRRQRVRSVPLTPPLSLVTPLSVRAFNRLYRRAHRDARAAGAAGLPALLLPARRRARLEPDLRPARLLPVPVRRAGSRAAGRDARAAGDRRRRRHRLVPRGAEDVRRARAGRAAELPDGRHHARARLPEPRRRDARAVRAPRRRGRCRRRPALCREGRAHAGARCSGAAIRSGRPSRPIATPASRRRWRAGCSGTDADGSMRAFYHDCGRLERHAPARPDHRRDLGDRARGRAPLCRAPGRAVPGRPAPARRSRPTPPT